MAHVHAHLHTNTYTRCHDDWLRILKMGGHMHTRIRTHIYAHTKHHDDELWIPSHAASSIQGGHMRTHIHSRTCIRTCTSTHIHAHT